MRWRFRRHRGLILRFDIQAHGRGRGGVRLLLGEERGPRLGSFIALYGLAETRALIDRALAGELVGAV